MQLTIFHSVSKDNETVTISKLFVTSGSATDFIFPGITSHG